MSLKRNNVHLLRSKYSFSICSSILPEDLPRNNSKRTFIGIYDDYGKYYVMTSSGALYRLEDLNDDINLQHEIAEGGENDTQCGNNRTYDTTLLSTVSLKRVFKPFLGKLQVIAFTIFSCGCDDPLQQQIIYCDDQWIYQHSLEESASMV